MPQDREEATTVFHLYVAYAQASLQSENSSASCGWKDTIQAYPGQVTTIRVRFAPQDVAFSEPRMNLFPFNPADMPGCVWHCHKLDHEDNEMMRPYKSH